MKLDASSVAAKELLGWAAVLNGQYPAAEAVIKDAGISDENLLGYRLGVILYAQGPSRYAEAKDLLEKGQVP